MFTWESAAFGVAALLLGAAAGLSLAEFTRWRQLIEDQKDGRLSHTKIGAILAGVVFTFKMVKSLPDDPWLWFTYMGTVGGYAIAAKAITARFMRGAQDDSK